MKLEFCGCCGHDVQVKDDVNSEDVYCKDCMGYPNSKSFKKKLGWAGKVFYEARFSVVKKTLSPKNRPKWDSFNYEKKCATIARLVEKGVMI